MKDNKVPIEIIAQSLIAQYNPRDNALLQKQNSDSVHLSSIRSLISSCYNNIEDNTFNCNIAKMRYDLRHSFTHQRNNIPVHQIKSQSQISFDYKAQIEEAKRYISSIESYKSNSIEEDDSLRLYLLNHPLCNLLLPNDIKETLTVNQSKAFNSQMTNNANYTCKANQPINISEDEIDDLILSPLHSEGDPFDNFVLNSPDSNQHQNQDVMSDDEDSDDNEENDANEGNGSSPHSR